MLKKLFVSNSLHVLASSLAHVQKSYYASDNDLQVCSTIVVQSATMENYIRREIAMNVGVCANLTFYEGIHKLFETWCLQDQVVAWTENYFFSVLYPYFLETLEPEMAISRARTHAQTLLRLGYERPELLMGYRHRREVSEKYRSIFRSFDHILSVAGGWIQLPVQCLQSMGRSLNRIPRTIYIFDPAPLSKFDQDWVRFLSEYADVFVFAFNPFEYKLLDHARQCKEATVYLVSQYTNDGSDISQSQADDTKRHCLISRCGKISLKCAEAWAELIDDLPEEIYLIGQDEQFQAEAMSQLERIQYETLVLCEACKCRSCKSETCKCETCDTMPLCGTSGKCIYKETWARDESIVFCGFKNAQDEVQWIADQIERLVISQDENLGLESIAVLVPYSVVELYGQLIRAEFIRRKIPHNIHALISQPLEVCYSAFSAFVEFLCSLATRETVLKWAFHEGVAENPDEFESFAQFVDQFGIYVGLDADVRNDLGGSAYLKTSESFTWADGIERFCAACLHTPATSGCEILRSLDHEQLQVVMRCWQTIRAMLEDHRVVRMQRLSYGQWRELVYCLFDTWLRADVLNREMAMGRLWQLLAQKWPSDHGVYSQYSFEAIIPLLRAFVRQLENEEGGRLTGGIQVRPFSCDVFTSQYVFLCGQSRVNFPSQVFGKRRYAFAQEDIDAHAWLKWIHNVQQGLYITAALPYTVNDEDDGCCKLADFSIFAEDLAHHLGKSSIALYSPQTQGKMQEALSVLRQAWHCELRKETQAWPMRLSDFDSHVASKVSEVLNGAFLKRKVMCQLENTHARRQDRLFEDDHDTVKSRQPRQLGLFDVPTPIDSSSSEEQQISLSHDIVEKSLDWKALFQMFDNPRKTWRKYYLNIRDSVRPSPRMKARVGVEPIERVDSDYRMRMVVSDLMGYALATGVHSLDRITADYDALMYLFKALGLYPDMIYGEFQRDRDLRMMRAFVEALPGGLDGVGAICACPILYRFGQVRKYHGLVEDWFAKRFKTQVVECHLPPFKVMGPNGKWISMTLTGELPLVAQGTQGSAFVISDMKNNNLAAMAAGIAGCLLTCAHQAPLPQKMIIFDRKAKFERKTPALNLPDRDTAESLLLYFSGILASGKHEIAFAKDLSKLGNDIYTHLKQTPLYRYLGDNKALDSESVMCWKRVFESEMFALLKSICGL